MTRKNDVRAARIRAAFAECAEMLVDLDVSRAGSVTIHFTAGASSFKDEWNFQSRLILPAGAATTDNLRDDGDPL